MYLRVPGDGGTVDGCAREHVCFTLVGSLWSLQMLQVVVFSAN